MFGLLQRPLWVSSKLDPNVFRSNGYHHRGHGRASAWASFPEIWGRRAKKKIRVRFDSGKTETFSPSTRTTPSWRMSWTFRKRIGMKCNETKLEIAIRCSVEEHLLLLGSRYLHCCLRPKAKDLGITWVVLVLVVILTKARSDLRPLVRMNSHTAKAKT